MFFWNSDNIVPVMIFAIPIIAIAAGVTLGVARILANHRLIELAQRERIAAIERGVDPAKLPPPPGSLNLEDGMPVFMTARQSSLRQSRGLMVGGMVVFATGIGLALMLRVLVDGEDGQRVWAVGLIPGFVGLALIAGSLFVRANAERDEGSHPTAGH